MTTVAIKDEYAEVLAVLGDMQHAVDLALQRYTIEQITAKVADLRRRDAVYQAKYGMDYPTFAQRTAEDEQWVVQVEQQVVKTWEIDLAEWEFCHEGAKDWTRRLQSILLES